MQPRFIKKLDSQSFFTQFASWLKEFPVMTFFYLILVTVCTILRSVFADYLSYLNLSKELRILLEMFVCKSVLEFCLFIGMTSGILYQQEHRGSCRYLLAFPLRYVLVMGIQIGCSYLSSISVEIPDILTSTPLLFCLFVASQQSINLKISAVDILKLPLQIKTGLYPLCLILILELIQTRVDAISVYIIGIAFDLINVKKLIIFLAKRFHAYCCRCCFKNFVKPPMKIEEYHSPTKKQVDNLATSNSIVIEDQINE